jgi:cytochrome b561
MPGARGDRRRGAAPMTVAVARYTHTAAALHWLSAALIVGGFAIGLWMTGLAFGPLKVRWYAYHKWIGITVFLLAALRIAWRWRHAPPPQVPMPQWQRRAATATHLLLYALMLLIPLSGWVYSSATGVSVVYLGLFPLPDLVARDKGLAVVLKAVHGTLNYTLLALVCVHAGAALKHHLVDRDGVLARMWPFARRA